MTARPSPAELVAAAVAADLRVIEIMQEPDGTVRVLTAPNDNAPIDPLAEARAKRAASEGANDEI